MRLVIHFDFSSGDSGNAEQREKSAFESQLAACGFVPFLERVSAAAGAAGADRNGFDAVGERNVCVGRRTLDARLIADVIVGGAQRGEKLRVSGEFAARARAEDFNLPLELPFRAIARRLHFVAHACGDRFAQRGFEFREFVFVLGANVDFQFRFVRNRVDGGTALDLSEIECGARACGNFCVDEANRSHARAR